MPISSANGTLTEQDDDDELFFGLNDEYGPFTEGTMFAVFDVPLDYSTLPTGNDREYTASFAFAYAGKVRG
jgi:hypothetical protein